MAMPFGPMHMAMGELFFGGVSDRHDVNVKIKRLIRQGVIQVNGHILVFHLGHGGQTRTLAGFSLKLGAHRHRPGF